MDGRLTVFLCLSDKFFEIIKFFDLNRIFLYMCYIKTSFLYTYTEIGEH